LASETQVAVVKIGAEGSYVMQGDIFLKVPAIKTQMIDATAAGDFYAAGFFYGMIHKASLEQCGRIGSLLASNVIRVVGTKLSEDMWEKIRSGAAGILN
jgi:sugar/nucleoside kinase (ribokinase family)